MKQTRLVHKLLFAMAALVVFAFSYYLGNRYARPGHDSLQAFVLPTPHKMDSFVLQDENGQPFDEQGFADHWNLVMAGNLQDGECRSLLVRYVLAWNYLAADPELQKKTRVVFLDTSDPPLSPERLGELIDSFNPAFTAVNGSHEEGVRLARQMGIPAADIEAGIPCDSQNSVVALINPDGYLLALFTAVTDPAAIARDLRFFQ